MPSPLGSFTILVWNSILFNILRQASKRSHLNESVGCPTDGLSSCAEVLHGEAAVPDEILSWPRLRWWHSSGEMSLVLWSPLTMMASEDCWLDWQKEYQAQPGLESVWSMLLLISGSPMTSLLYDIKRGNLDHWHLTFLQNILAIIWILLL